MEVYSMKFTSALPTELPSRDYYDMIDFLFVFLWFLCSSCCKRARSSDTPRRLHMEVYSMKFTSALPTELPSRDYYDMSNVCIVILWLFCSSCCRHARCSSTRHSVHMGGNAMKVASGILTERRRRVYTEA